MTTLRISTPADDIAEVLIDEQAIAAKVRELGTAIADDYRTKDLVLVSILKGALPFLADRCGRGADAASARSCRVE